MGACWASCPRWEALEVAEAFRSTKCYLSVHLLYLSTEFTFLIASSVVGCIIRGTQELGVYNFALGCYVPPFLYSVRSAFARWLQPIDEPSGWHHSCSVSICSSDICRRAEDRKV